MNAASPKRSLARVLLFGFLAGLLAGVTMLAVMAALRLWLGIATPAEMIFDRAFPFVTVKFFIGSLVRAGGYSQLKLQGFAASMAGHLVAAGVGGMIYAWSVQRRGRGWRLVVPGVLAVWLLIVAALWPQLATDYAGRPPTLARVVTIGAMLAGFALCGAALMLFQWLLEKAAPYPREVAFDIWQRRDERARRRAESRGCEHPQVNPDLAAYSPAGRRRFLALGLGAVASFGLAKMLGRLYRLGTFHYDGTQYGGPEVAKIAPNDRFYQVTKNLVDPDVARDIWRFDIVGNVENPRVWTFAELTALPAVEQETTLQCISYGVGSGLISNAEWKGVPLPTLLAQVRPKADCATVLFHAADGFFETFPLAKANELTTLVAYEMNGEPLPPHHGFPVRMIVPGIYGERMPKWVTRLEFLSKDDPRLKINRHGIEGVGFYTEQGWGPNIYVPTTSRIDAPAHGVGFDEPFKVGQAVELRGMAFGGDKGISAVEVSTDGGETYAAAEIYAPGTDISWHLWRYQWTPTAVAGEIRVFVRAINGRGERQIEPFRDQVPHGALGLHWVAGRVI